MSNQPPENPQQGQPGHYPNQPQGGYQNQPSGNFPPQGYQQPPPGYYNQPPQKKSHTLRNVLLILLALGVLFIGGCAVLFGAAVNSVDSAISEEDKNDTPTAIEDGEAFEHDGFAAKAGWSVVNERFSGANIKNMTVTLTDDQDTASGGRSALLTFRLYDGKNVVGEISCTSPELQEGESGKLDCFGDGEKLSNYDTIKVADAF